MDFLNWKSWWCVSDSVQVGKGTMSNAPCAYNCCYFTHPVLVTVGHAEAEPYVPSSFGLKEKKAIAVQKYAM
jgi:hypothetical protein